MLLTIFLMPKRKVPNYIFDTFYILVCYDYFEIIYGSDEVPLPPVILIAESRDTTGRTPIEPEDESTPPS